MNKAVLIIICDFLLISILAMMPDGLEPQDPNTTVDAASQADPESDLVEMMKSALEEERKSRQDLDHLLQQAKSAIDNRDAAIAERDDLIQKAAERLRNAQDQSRELTQQRQQLEQDLQSKESNLQSLRQQFAAAQTNLLALDRDLQSTQNAAAALERQKRLAEQQLTEMQTRVVTSRSQLESLQQTLEQSQSEARVQAQLAQALQQDLQSQVQQSAQLQSQVQSLDQARETAVLQSQQLSGRLQVAQTESRLTSEQLQAARKDIESVRQEKQVIAEQTATLAQDVASLATSSDQLTQEIRQSRPLTPNSIFSEFISNRVHSSFQATRTGVFGQDVRKDAVANTVFFRAKDKVFAVYHVGETPIDLAPVPNQWSSLQGTFRRGDRFTTMAVMAFLDRDPRIVISPASTDQIQKLGAQVYQLSSEAFKFEDAVLVGATDNYYGECRFQIDPETPGYMKMQREFLGRMFGKFVPSKGDLVFAKTGELIGMMANKEYCVVFDNLGAARSIRLGSDLSSQFVTALLSQMYYQVSSMPLHLQ